MLFKVGRKDGISMSVDKPSFELTQSMFLQSSSMEIVLKCLDGPYFEIA
jgi:hypothetical protein